MPTDRPESLPSIPDSSLPDRERLFAAYSSTAGLCILDTEYKYLWTNDQLAKMHGIPASAHFQKTVRDVLGPLADVIETNLHQVLRTGEPVLSAEISRTLPGRATAHWMQHYFPLKNASGAVTRIGIVSLEIHEKKTLQKAVCDLDGKLRKELARLKILMDVTSLMSSNWDIPVVFPTISARIRRLLQQEFASFSLYDPHAQVFIRQGIDFPLGKGRLASTPVGAKNSPAGRALQEKVPLIFSKSEMEAFDADMVRSFLEEGMQSLCCVPMMRPNGPIGVLTLGSTRADAFHSDDLDLLKQVATQMALALENHRVAAEIKQLQERLQEERQFLRTADSLNAEFPDIVGTGSALQQVLQEAATVATSEATVLILGETGTGKELIANAIHRLSRRASGPMIKLNCAAIPTGLLESELFGHEKGAFTGAVSQKVGRVELADLGTLFLDEVGEIPLDLQPKLLRVLQDQEFERLGSNRTIKVNVRLIAATNRNLSQRVADHQFRSDLFYRLNVFPITVPPLRDRPEDIPALVRHFVSKFAKRMDRHIESVPRSTMEALRKWHWPGNVRELENLIERAVILSQASVLNVPISELRLVHSGKKDYSDRSLDEAERQHIIRVLKETGGKLSGPNGAARRLGLKRTTLQSKMQRLKITRGDYASPPQQ
jgi:formate hydrogenlyase transcriptional activator